MTAGLPSHTDPRQHAPVPGHSTGQPTLGTRLDALREHLQLANEATDALVRRLEPVLPADFNSGPTPAADGSGAPSSSLAENLEWLAARAHELVLRLQRICEAVDL